MRLHSRGTQSRAVLDAPLPNTSPPEATVTHALPCWSQPLLQQPLGTPNIRRARQQGRAV